MSTHATARLSGLIYLLVVITGLFSIMYVTQQTRVPGDPDATLAAIRTHDTLFRWGIAGWIVNQLATLLLALALYRLLEPVSRAAAVLMVAFAAMGVPLVLGHLSHLVDVLELQQGLGVFAGLSPDQVRAATLHALGSFGNGVLMAEVFWGLWLLPLGWLVLRGDFLPSLLGVLLILGGCGYLLLVFGTVLMPGFETSPMSDYILLPASVGEIGTCLWLVLMGARKGFVRRP